ncbi:Inherit from NOG: NmrA-like family [Seminavis robusta]|uniref:Inherit from NOG: NmrA-like family n=1 Tax=Seminavis robusta TaxID=568900 RepID=A0A9N8HFN2_9STRA|nr:Inherit from NOG: NmrA-like family [Seminavis robusta]|eukprot:Sro356_g125450.1 Inherit from NOG: NmrA-like family (312) ;mRNA; r:61093-62139
MVDDECSNLTCSDVEDNVKHTLTSKTRSMSHDSLRVSHHDDEEECRRRSSNDSSDDDDSHCEDDGSDDDDSAETIALFGVDGRTGHHFLRLALDAGYKVRALVTPTTKLEGQAEFEDLHTVFGTVNEHAKIQEVVYSSTYVVCMVGETALANATQSSGGGYPKEYMLQFVKTLFRVMGKQDDPPIKGFLFQATSLAKNQWGELPALSAHIRNYWIRRRTLQYLQDLDGVIQYIHSQSWGADADDDKVAFPYIITRPTSFLRDGRSTKKLQASKSQPGFFPYCNADLAEFTLNALKMPKLYNTCRYVVGDGC